MKQYPCENCSIRKPACQDTCTRLKEHLAERQNIKDQIKAEKAKEKQAEEFKNDRIRKAKKRA